MAGDGHYVLNGNWAVSPPGTYEAAGTHVVYTRAAGAEETLRAAGPTSQDLLLQVWSGPPGEGRARGGERQRIWGGLGWGPAERLGHPIGVRPSSVPHRPHHPGPPAGAQPWH